MKFIYVLKLLIIFLILASLPVETIAQKRNKVSVEVMGSVFAQSRKHFQYNTNEGFYWEARIGYQWNRYLETSVSAGYQLRNYTYFAQKQQPYGELAMVMKRFYVPVALNTRLNLSEFFYEKLKLWKKPDRWDVYTQVSLATIRGHDERDLKTEDLLRSQGAYVPYYRYPYTQVYNRLHIAYVGGLRYNIKNSMGVFIEGGEGLLTNAVLGLTIRL